MQQQKVKFTSVQINTKQISYENACVWLCKIIYFISRKNILYDGISDKRRNMAFPKTYLAIMSDIWTPYSGVGSVVFNIAMLYGIARYCTRH